MDSFSVKCLFLYLSPPSYPLVSRIYSSYRAATVSEQELSSVVPRQKQYSHTEIETARNLPSAQYPAHKKSPCLLL